jgi:hypothetical protein
VAVDGAQDAAQGRRSPDGDSLFEWDSLHGEIEWYNKRGRHRGSLDAITGEVIKPEVRGRRIDV